MSLHDLKQYIYSSLIDIHMEAMMNTMQTIFCTLQSAPKLDEEILLKGQKIFQLLYVHYFTNDVEVRIF